MTAGSAAAAAQRASRAPTAAPVLPAAAPGAQMTPGGIQEWRSFDTVDGLYDCAWSEENENILASASGDGSIKARALACEACGGSAAAVAGTQCGP